MEQPLARDAGHGLAGLPEGADTGDDADADAGDAGRVALLPLTVPPPEAARPTALRESAARRESAGRVPVQPGPGDCADRGSARGEHTHSEPPMPAARTPDRPQIRRVSVRGQILDALRSALVEGELAPGEVYSAPVLGERFGVSATPVREAMQQLAVEGAVEVVPNRGFRVTERSARELDELVEVRALLEVPVMLRLARTVPAERWTELRPLAEATSKAASRGDRASYAEADRAFHRAVLALSGNVQLVRTADELHRRAQWPPAAGPVAWRRADLVADAAEHMALLEALSARELGAVETLVREHFADGSV